jgi:1-aminocyclopropane-1-carboxylate deaminase
LLNLQLPSPLQEIKDSLLSEKDLRLFIKREDQIHPVVSGNKWRKLKYNLIRAQAEGHTTLLSFGGAYSNHLHALAAASHAAGLKSIGVVRGEELSTLNTTLLDAKSNEMELYFISREDYKNKTKEYFINALREKFGNFYLIPEGGYNEEGMKGCGEIIQEIEIDFNVICTACGTGTTLAGIIHSLPEGKKAIGFPVLKGGDFLYEEINNLLSSSFESKNKNWHLESNYHFGGYAKWNQNLLDFMHTFEQKQDILLDQVYTGKMMYGLFDLIGKDFFPKGTTLIALHTGGLQGLSGLK